MSFLDRFKPQPKYRNPDPAIRLAGVAELPDDAEHWGVIAELAASDEDVRVRRAAIEQNRRRRLSRPAREDGTRRLAPSRAGRSAGRRGQCAGRDRRRCRGGTRRAQRSEVVRNRRQIISARHGPDRGAREDSRREGPRERRAPRHRRADCPRSGLAGDGSGRARRGRQQDGTQGCGHHGARTRRRVNRL